METSTGKDAWKRFLEFSSWARAKPSFDVEEREPKLELAGALRPVLEVAREGNSWLPELEQTRILQGHLPGMIAAPIPLGFVGPELSRLFRAWASFDEAAVGRALAQFLVQERDPLERFALFAEAAEKAQAAAGVSADTESVVAFGSLFNFGVAPDALPLVRPGPFRALGQILGYRLDASSPVAEYQSHLAFAREQHERLEEAGVPVRDMVDVQCLMLLAHQFRKLWAPCIEPAKRPQTGGGARKQRASYLGVCAIYRDEGPYLREWIELHRLAGVERFFLYDNGSSDDHLEILAPYRENGTVVLHEWPGPRRQLPAYDHCLNEHASDSRWIAFIDLDEFLFAPSGQPLPEVLVDYESFAAVGVNWAIFGPSGHVSKPAGLVVESYVQRLNIPDNRTIRSVVDPTQALRSLSAHQFSYKALYAVDENKYPILSYYTKSVSFSRLRVNHYFTKSLSEYRERSARTRPDQVSSQRQQRVGPERVLEVERTTGERDEAILTYLPALREALSQGPEGVGSPVL